MRIDFGIGPLKAQLWIGLMTRVRGVSSELSDGNHILMWDFDNVPLEQVAKGLRHVQTLYGLPDIHVLRTRKQSYHAYCFRRLAWDDACNIVSHTVGVDRAWLKLSIWREYFTLRYSRKGNSPEMAHAITLEAPTMFPDIDARTEKLKHIEYETRR